VIRSVAVFCGSRFGNDPAFAEAATALGAGLARSGRRLVYGGGRVGLMGLVADAALDMGGEVLGVIPEFLTRREVAHDRLRNLVVTETMHDRKRRFYDESDAFVGLPGGIGTMDELIEVITWRQLGQHDKPILLCDINGSAQPLLDAMEATISNGFSEPGLRDLFDVVHGVADTLSRLDTLPAGHEAGLANV
jgi:uncharacterized protein (TIGR00730 family)